MAGLLPFIAWASIIAAMLYRFPRWEWRKAVLRATVAWGAYLVVSTEVLSLVHGLVPHVLGVIWAAPALGLWMATRRRQRAIGSGPLQRLSRPGSWIGYACLLLIVVIVLTTAVIAWVSPPNTYDSLTYHMSRVAHWAQNRSLQPFATGILRQAYMSPGAEMMVLHLYVLGGGDRLANFAQWFAMVVCLVGATRIASSLGATGAGQWLASLFVVTLPMGIAQSSSTMTDYIVALWVTCAVAEAVEVIASGPSRANMITMPVAAGLAVLTKPTGAVFLAPFAVLGAWVLVRHFRAKEMMALGSLALLSVIGLNLGYLMRNIEVFGAPFGSADITGQFTNAEISLRVAVSNALRNASLHAGTSWQWLNDELYLALAKVHWKLGLRLNDPLTSWHRYFSVRTPSMGENIVGNPCHAVLGLLAVGLLPAFRRTRAKPLALYAGLVSLSFLVYGAMFKFDILGSRYHLPFFVLLAPLVGVVLGSSRGWVQAILIACLAASAYRPLVQLEERPILNLPGRPSIFLLPREDMYLGDDKLAPIYRQYTSAIRAEGCDSLGLMLLGNTREYPIWVLMGAPRDTLTVDWIVSRGSSIGRYRLQDFEACAVICELCPASWTTLNGLPRVHDVEGFQLYLREGPSE